MACKYIIKPKTGPNAGKEVESKLYNDLVDITGSEKSADIVYSQTHHPTFLRKFGNWLSNKGVVSEFRDENGEPLLLDKDTNPHFSNKDVIIPVSDYVEVLSGTNTRQQKLSLELALEIENQ